MTFALGSRIYIPAYRRSTAAGWFDAQDIGSAIKSRHIDIYRARPTTAGDRGRYLRHQRIYVIAPATDSHQARRPTPR